MKGLIVTIVFVFAVLLLFVMHLKRNDTLLKPGSISFISMKSGESDGFAIRTNVNISPRTRIRFTDSEWNGNHFGFDENDMLWISGDTLIKAESVINFSNLNANATVSYGTILGSMQLSKKSEAIFAYMGGERMPTVFLAAIANNEFGYGTILNTGLINGETAITLPKEY